MLHIMKLKQEPFKEIKNGSKKIELRLYDKKRQQVQIYRVFYDKQSKREITDKSYCFASL